MYRRMFIGKTVAAIAATVLSQTVPVFAKTTRAPANHIININGFKFSPKVLTVSVGDRITWINKDIVPHTATALDRSWDTGLLNSNERKEIIVKEGMAENYFCLYHPTMKAKLRLKN